MMLHQLKLTPTGKADKYMAACSCLGWATNNVSAKKGNAGYERHVRKVRKDFTRSQKKKKA